MTRRLPVVSDSVLAAFDHIDIATPCSVEWDAMAGDDRVRHCSDCRLHVYNVSEMTRAEAATLIATNEASGGRTCLRLYRRPDGTLLTQDCWARLRAARQRGWFAFAAALVIVCLTQLGLRFAALGWLIKQTQPPPVASETLPPAQTKPAPPPVVLEEPMPLYPEDEPVVAQPEKPKHPSKPKIEPPVERRPHTMGIAVRRDPNPLQDL